VPVAGPYRALRTSQRSADDRIPVRAVRLAAVILAPRRFVCVLMEKVTANPVMLADFGAAQEAEIAFRLIDVRPVLGLVLD